MKSHTTILILSFCIAVLGIFTGRRAGRVAEAASEDVIVHDAIAIGDYACAAEANTFTVVMKSGDHIVYENTKTGKKVECVFELGLKCTVTEGETK